MGSCQEQRDISQLQQLYQDILHELSETTNKLEACSNHTKLCKMAGAGVSIFGLGTMVGGTLALPIPAVLLGIGLWKTVASGSLTFAGISLMLGSYYYQDSSAKDLLKKVGFTFQSAEFVSQRAESTITNIWKKVHELSKCEEDMASVLCSLVYRMRKHLPWDDVTSREQLFDSTENLDGHIPFLDNSVLSKAEICVQSILGLKANGEGKQLNNTDILYRLNTQYLLQQPFSSESVEEIKYLADTYKNRISVCVNLGTLFKAINI